MVLTLNLVRRCCGTLRQRRLERLYERQREQQERDRQRQQRLRQQQRAGARQCADRVDELQEPLLEVV